MLHCHGMTFFESRDFFDLFVRDYPEFKHYIADDVAIVEDVVFERAIMKIARGLPLSKEKLIAGLRILQPDNPMFKAMRMHHLGNLLKITYKPKNHIPKHWSESSSDSKE